MRRDGIGLDWIGLARMGFGRDWDEIRMGLGWDWDGMGWSKALTKSPKLGDSVDMK